MAVGSTETGNWGPDAGSVSHLDPHAVSPDTGVAMDANSPKQGDGNLLSGMNRSANIIQAEPPGCCRIVALGGSNLFPYSPSSIEVVWGNWSDSDMTTPK